jgi:phosphopantetheinyl transferase
MKTKSSLLTLTRTNSVHNFGISKINGSVEELESNLSELHSKELKNYASFRHDSKKTSYLLGKFSAKRAIYSLTNFNKFDTIFIDAAVFEFPVVRCSGIQNIQVSISHCNNTGLSIAFPEEHPMGIDFEEINKDNTEALKDQLTLKEVQLVKELFSEDTFGFTLIWTAKEALSKVFRTGLMMDFKVLELDQIIKKDNIWESTFKNCGQYKAISYFSENYMYSLVLPKYTSIDISELLNVLKPLN